MSLPRATYRLQFRAGMTFERAAALTPYWRRLGISHLYVSPVFAARDGSAHGYDIVDFNRLDPALGGDGGFRHLSAALKQEGLGLILDFVPNHMAASAQNRWWQDVLAHGRRSRFAGHFDIDWQADKLLLPILGRPYGEALERGELSVSRDADGRLCMRYSGHALPLSPETNAALAGTGDGALAGLARDRLHALHEEQSWRLAHWRAARDSLTYRRFFEISDLVGVRVEDDAVFDDVHRLLLRLVADGHVDGIRIDHVDGLADPKRYLERLRGAVAGADVYLVVEKILETGEQMPADWPVAGTTGYEFIAFLSRLLTADGHLEELDGAYRGFTGDETDYATQLLAAKRETLTRNLASELSWLTRAATAIAAGEPAARGFDAETLRQAIVALVCAFPVYRSYVDAAGGSAADGRLVDAVAAAARARPDVEAAAVDFVARLLALDRPAARRADLLRFARRFQQTTGPVMAKALEDTLFYRYNRLLALNEVGGDPQMLGGSTEALHALMTQRVRDTPHGLSATATHDTKRGEDARARLYVISEVPGTWRDAVRRWSAMNARHRRVLADGPAPEAQTEWLIYQALLGVWPATLAPGDVDGIAALRERFRAYALKALREAKVRTHWTAPAAAYEQAVSDFVACLLAPDNDAFLADFVETCQPLFRAGMVNGLVQTLLKLTAPGVPDIYQGTEFQDLSLVDPDNRRPVDFDAAAALLRSALERPAGDLTRDWRDGALKLRVLAAGLDARRRGPELFRDGDYHPLSVTGARAGHVFSFARTTDADAALVIVPRWPLALLSECGNSRIAPEAWGDTAVRVPRALQGRDFRDAFAGRVIVPGAALALAEALSDLPVALLQSWPH